MSAKKKYCVFGLAAALSVFFMLSAGSADEYDGYETYDDSYEAYNDGYETYDDGYEAYDGSYETYDDGYEADDGYETYEADVAYEDTSLTELLEVIDSGSALGDYGRLFIPEVGISVALYYSDNSTENEAQQITDRQDSAVYMPWTRRQDMIADHWTQGFLEIRDCREGTRAYIRKDDRVEIYVCTESTVGHNMTDYFLIETSLDHSFSMPVPYEEEALTESSETEAESETDISYMTTPQEWVGYYTVAGDENESEPETQTEVFWGQPLEYIDDFDLFMYTCNGRWQDVYLVLFRLEDILYL